MVYRRRSTYAVPLYQLFPLLRFLKQAHILYYTRLGLTEVTVTIIAERETLEQAEAYLEALDRETRTYVWTKEDAAFVLREAGDWPIEWTLKECSANKVRVELTGQASALDLFERYTKKQS